MHLLCMRDLREILWWSIVRTLHRRWWSRCDTSFSSFCISSFSLHRWSMHSISISIHLIFGQVHLILSSVFQLFHLQHDNNGLSFHSFFIIDDRHLSTLGLSSEHLELFLRDNVHRQVFRISLILYRMVVYLEIYSSVPTAQMNVVRFLSRVKDRFPFDWFFWSVSLHIFRWISWSHANVQQCARWRLAWFITRSNVGWFPCGTNLMHLSFLLSNPFSFLKF